MTQEGYKNDTFGRRDLLVAICPARDPKSQEKENKEDISPVARVGTAGRRKKKILPPPTQALEQTTEQNNGKNTV